MTRIIVVGLCSVLMCLSACGYSSVDSGGPLNATPTPAPVGTMMPTPSPSAQTTRTPSHTSGGVTATILIQGTQRGFAVDCGCGSNGTGIIIDSNQWVRIATDGTGEVSGYMKTFTFTPTPSQVGLSAGLPAASMTNDSQTTYYVPSDCMTQFDAARSASFEQLRNETDDYQRATHFDAQPMLGPLPVGEYPATFDPAHILCSPAAGYQQATPFYYTITMPVHVTVPYFKVSAVVAFRKQQAIAHTPANFTFESIAKACDLPYVQKVSATVVQYRCSIGGYYHWTWTPTIARTLAAQIAGKDLTSARDILAAYPGADISRGQGISIQLASGNTLPSDPSQIRFKIYDTVVVGTDGVQTTGTPQIVP